MSESTVTIPRVQLWLAFAGLLAAFLSFVVIATSYTVNTIADIRAEIKANATASNTIAAANKKDAINAAEALDRRLLVVETHIANLPRTYPPLIFAERVFALEHQIKDMTRRVEDIEKEADTKP